MKTRKLIFILLSLMFVGGCISLNEINRAHYAIKAAWQKDLDALLDDFGARTYAIPKSDAMKAMRKAVQSIGMVVGKRDLKKGVLSASSVAPKPLTNEEWLKVEEHETPRMKEIIAREIGPRTAALFALTPEHYLVVFVAAFAENKKGTHIGFTAEMEYLGLLQRVYLPKIPPPTAARYGLVKIWNNFDRELGEMGFDVNQVRAHASKERGPRTSPLPARSY